MNLSKHFTKKEAIEWARLQSMSKKDTDYCINLSTDNWTPQIEENAKKISEKLEQIREKINNKFPEYKGEIGIKALSWFRAKEWELYRKRSGGSEHINGWAVDWIVTNVSTKDFPLIMDWIWKELKEWNGGLARFYKNKKWTFIHIDLGRKRRWEY